MSVSQVGQAVYANDDKSGIYAAKVPHALGCFRVADVTLEACGALSPWLESLADGVTTRLCAGAKSRIQP